MARPRMYIPVGSQFGKYTVLGESHRHPKTNTMHYLSRCECGVEKAVTYANLSRVKLRGTGCFTCSVASRPKTGANNTSRKQTFDEYGNVVEAPLRHCRKCGTQLPITRYFNCNDCARHIGFDDEGLC